MIVLDASLIVELLTNSAGADDIRGALFHSQDSFIAPHLVDVEVVSALRSLAAGGKIDHHRCDQMLGTFAVMPIDRYPHKPLLRRLWELRHNFTAYDAAYIALAEATGAVLFTCDEKLRGGHRAKVRVFSV